MKNPEITALKLNIPFVVSFKHASSEREMMNSVLVRIKRDGNYGLGEGCPREYVTGENLDSAISWINKNKVLIESECTSLKKLKKFVEENESLIDGNESAWCAVETALLDLFGKEENKSIEELLGIKERKEFYYTAVVGNGGHETLENLFDIYSQYGFSDFKMKISGDIEQDLLKVNLFREKILKDNPEKARLRIDANNFWNDANEAFDYINKLDFPFLGVEEPFAPRETEKVESLLTSLKIPAILDESLCRISDIDLYNDLPCKYIANIKLSKVGGLLRAMGIAEKLKELNRKIIIGSHVGETSILTRLSLTFAGYCGENLIAQEGAFGTFLIKHDVVEPVLTFGKGAKLSIYKFSSDSLSGLGLSANGYLNNLFNQDFK